MTGRLLEARNVSVEFTTRSGYVARAAGGCGVGGATSRTGRGVYVPFTAGLPNLQISTTFRSVSFALPCCSLKKPSCVS